MTRKQKGCGCLVILRYLLILMGSCLLIYLVGEADWELRLLGAIAIGLLILLVVIPSMIWSKLMKREITASIGSVEEAMKLQREVKALMADGEKIKAIKLLRAQTDLGLRDAKSMVESVEGWAFTDANGSTLSPDQWTDEARQIPLNVRQAVLDRDDYICRYCGCRSQTMEVDHVIPVSQGGTSALDNLVTACRKCNRKKGGRTPEEAEMEVLPVRTQRPDWR